MIGMIGLLAFIVIAFVLMAAAASLDSASAEGREMARLTDGELEAMAESADRAADGNARAGYFALAAGDRSKAEQLRMVLNERRRKAAKQATTERTSPPAGEKP